MFSEQALRRFLQRYQEHEQAVLRRNKARNAKSALLTVEELLPRHVQDCLSDHIFDVTELTNATIREGIARHAEC